MPVSTSAHSSLVSVPIILVKVANCHHVVKCFGCFFQPYLIHSAACITIDLSSSQNPFLSGLSFLQWPLILKLMLIASGFVEIPLFFLGCSQLCLHISIIQESSQMQGCWDLWAWNSDFGRFYNFPRWPCHLICTQGWEQLPEVVSFSSMVLRIIVTRPDYY